MRYPGETITFEFGSAIFSGVDEDGHPIVQFDGLGEDPKVGHYELHHTFGFASRPRDPDVGPDGAPLEGKACNILIGTEGDQVHGWLAHDPRFIDLIPKLKKGGSMRYCAAGSFEIFDGEDGTNTLYVPVPGDKAHVFTVGLDGNGAPFVSLAHANGMAVTMLEQSLVVKNAAGDAYIELNDGGIVLNGNTRLNGGLVLGSDAAVPLVLGPPLITLLQALAGIIDAKPPSGAAAAGLVSAAIATLQSLLAKAS